MNEGVSAKTLYVSNKQSNQNKALKHLEGNLMNRLYYNEKHKFIKTSDPKPQMYHRMLRMYHNESLPALTTETEEKIQDPNKFAQDAFRMGFYQRSKSKHQSDSLHNITKKYYNRSLSNFKNIK